MAVSSAEWGVLSDDMIEIGEARGMADQTQDVVQLARADRGNGDMLVRVAVGVDRNKCRTRTRIGGGCCERVGQGPLYAVD